MHNLQVPVQNELTESDQRWKLSLSQMAVPMLVEGALPETAGCGLLSELWTWLGIGEKTPLNC
jgi:hypothetical protein